MSDTTKFSVSKHLDSPQTMLLYMEDCLAEGGPDLFTKAVAEVCASLLSSGVEMRD